MNIGKIIEKIVAPALAEEGFQQVAGVGKNEWVFSRPQKGYYEGIKFRVNTLSLPQGSKYDIDVDFIANAPQAFPFPFHFYSVFGKQPFEMGAFPRYLGTEAEIEAFFDTVIQAIKETVIPLFPCFARPFLMPSDEMNLQLSKDTEEKAEAFRVQYALKWADNVDEIKEMIISLEKVIQGVQGKPLEEVSDFLIGATAYYGELVRRVHGGEWMWSPKSKKVFLLEGVGDRNQVSGALGIILDNWIWSELYGHSLRYNYHQLLRFLGLEKF